METRCGKCNKLFRVSDDKITGKGVKFACTRCGEYVKITKEEFEQYALSRTAVNALDMFEPKPKPEEASLPLESHRATANAPTVEPPSFQPAQSVSQEEQPPVFSEPAPFAETTPVAESKPAPESGPEPRGEQEPKQAQKPGPNPEETPAQRPATVQPKVEAKAGVEPKPDTARRTAQTTPRPASPAPQAAKKEPARPAPLQPREAVKEPIAPAPSRTGKMFMVLVIALIVIGLAGYGVFIYMQSNSQKVKEKAPEIFTTEGMLITKATGSWDAAGDLLISGVVENDLDKPRPAWYAVVDVYDAQGISLGRIRLLNGKQLYTRRDFEILAKRGVNIQELKTKYLQEQGVVIPPKGSVTFELRYLQPPAGLASFNATLQPFDPVQLFKETAEDLK